MFTYHRHLHASLQIVFAKRRIVALLLLTMAIAGCSGSSGGASESDATAALPNTTNMPGSVVMEDELSPMESGANADASGAQNTNNGAIDNNNSPDSATTLVTFNITVPAYVSNALQVRLVWGDKDLNASWVTDELWSVSDEFSRQTEHPLTVSFNDDNGAITLATYSADFKPDNVNTQTYKINANQFDSNSLDADQDGVSNLAESIAGTNPLGEDVPDAVEPSFNLVPDKTFRLTWQRSASAQYYRVLENPDGVSGFVQIGENIDASVFVFDHRVALFKRVNASYIVQACNEVGCTDSITLTVPGSIEDAITFVKANNTEALDVLGIAVALTSDGNMLAIGAAGEDSSSTQINGDQSNNDAGGSGAVYIFERVAGAWQEKDYIKASNAGPGDRFGASIGLSSDGNTLVVGAPSQSNWTADLNQSSSGRSDTNYGAVYFFTRTDGSWTQKAYLKPSVPTYRGFFGSKLSLSADGNTLAVGVARDNSGLSGINGDASDGGYAYRSGATYIYVRSGDDWEQQAYIKASNAQGGKPDQDGDYYGGDNFGSSVSLSGDGNTLAVGALNESSSAKGINADQSDNQATFSGAVYTFTRSGTNWQQQTYIKASNTERWDYFGSVVSLDSNGSTLAVYAPGEDSAATGIGGDQADNSTDSTGALYLFSQSNGVWQQQAYVKAETADTNLGFLSTSSFSEDGKTLVAGNMIYVYRDGTWSPQLNLQSVSGNEKTYNGRAVVSGDGNTIAIGNWSDESSATGLNGDRYDYFGDRSGAVYLY